MTTAKNEVCIEWLCEKKNLVVGKPLVGGMKICWMEKFFLMEWKLANFWQRDDIIFAVGSNFPVVFTQHFER